MKTTFTHATLVLPNGLLENGCVSIEEGRIVAVGASEPAGETVDCAGLFLLPGFVELHCHGGADCDFMDGTVEAFVTAARLHLRRGTTTLLPTTMTSSNEELFQVFDCFRAARKVGGGMPTLPGLHLEGPYLNPLQKGAQDDQYTRCPLPEDYEAILARGGELICRWSLAPELPGAMALIRRLHGLGILVSAAHTDATYPVMREAVEAGLRHVTHLYSGMSMLTRQNGYRQLGVVESAFLMDELSVELIADGVHLPPELLRLIVKCKPQESICLVTDSMRGAGMPDGPSVLGSRRAGQPVLLEGGVARTLDRQSFAGSIATADRLLRVMVTQCGLPLPQAARMLTENPARLIGLEKQKGTLAVGKDADFVLMDAELNVRAVYARGQLAR